jgi:mono/diheme cytochrome c family protein
VKRMPIGGVLLPLAVAAAALVGCRGQKSEESPFHLIDDMQNQAHRGPQSESPIFDDHRANRPYDIHAVARGRSRTRQDPTFLRENDAYFKGVDTGGTVLKRIPYEVTTDFVDRGRDRFNIYCAPCHDKTASGHGLVSQHSGGAFDNIPDLAQTDRLRDAPDGEIFQTITNGKARMPSYAAQIPAEDRWKIVSWVRVLQQSQHATKADAGANNIEPQESELK